jgi:hypothetical protein
MAAAAAAAKAPATVVLLGEDEVALGSVIKVAGLERQGGEGSKARVGRHEAAKLLARVSCIFGQPS